VASVARLWCDWLCDSMIDLLNVHAIGFSWPMDSYALMKIRVICFMCVEVMHRWGTGHGHYWIIASSCPEPTLSAKDIGQRVIVKLGCASDSKYSIGLIMEKL